MSTKRSNHSSTVGAMGMRCSRVGCSGHAVASFCFDGRAALVWLDPLDPERGVGAGVLCARHADTLTPPRGWHLQDRRTRTPRLWVDRPAGTPAAPNTLPVATEAVLATRDRSGEAAAARVGAPHADPLPFETEPAPRPVAKPADVADLLDARSPLLARAFAAAGSGPERPTSEG
jgi:hypothetical protein